MITFKKKYFVYFILLFLIEILIANFVDDTIIRPYIGDTLVVILIYCFVRCFFNFTVVNTTLGVLLFAFVIEILQYFKFVELIGLGNSRIALIVFGNSFAWLDLVAYSLGGLLILLAEKSCYIKRKSAIQR